MREDNIAIDVNNVSMCFNLEREKKDLLKEYIIARLKNKIAIEEFWALRDISFTIEKGTSFAIVGSNGSGKSTLMKLIAQVYKPSKGTIRVDGSIAPMIELGAGFDDQLTAGENIYLNGMVLGYRKEYLAERYNEIIEFSELKDFENVPLKNFSSGMKARLGFAVATLVQPEILLVDEVLGVGDYHFQQKCEERIAELLSGGTTLILVSHSRDQVLNLCEQAVWIEKGEMRAIGSAAEVCEKYQPSQRKSGADDAAALAKRENFKNNVTTFNVEVFSYCNRACWFCPNSSIDRRSDNIFLPEEIYLKILGELAEVEYDKTFGLIHFNEPLADRIIIKRVRQAGEYLPKAFITFNSNGDYLTKEYLDELSDAGLDELLVCIYLEADEEYTKEAFEAKLEKLLKRCETPDYEYEYQNEDSMCVRTSYDKMSLRVVCNDYNAEKKPGEAGQRVDRGGLVKGSGMERRIACKFPFRQQRVDYDGSFMLCCNVRCDTPEHKGAVMGNAKTDSIFDVWSGEKYRQMRERLDKDNGDYPDFCKHCHMEYYGK